MKLTVKEFARMVDLSAVRTDVDAAEVRAIAEAARKFHCISAVVMPAYTAELHELLCDAPDVITTGVVGFPSGGDLTGIKAAQARALIDIGCGELDMVANVGWLLSGRDAAVEDDVRAVVEAAEGKIVKVILEVTYLNDDQIRRGCEACVRAGAAFVKTGTGWAGKTTTLDHIRLMKSVVGDRAQVKAAGGVRDIPTAVAMYRLGVTRFGLSIKNGLKVLEQWAAMPGGAVEV